jgi:hypothetical protein
MSFKKSSFNQYGSMNVKFDVILILYKKNVLYSAYNNFCYILAPTCPVGTIVNAEVSDGRTCLFISKNTTQVICTGNSQLFQPLNCLKFFIFDYTGSKY